MTHPRWSHNPSGKCYSCHPFRNKNLEDQIISKGSQNETQGINERERKHSFRLFYIQFEWLLIGGGGGGKDDDMMTGGREEGRGRWEPLNTPLERVSPSVPVPTSPPWSCTRGGMDKSPGKQSSSGMASVGCGETVLYPGHSERATEVLFPLHFRCAGPSPKKGGLDKSQIQRHHLLLPFSQIQLPAAQV